MKSEMDFTRGPILGPLLRFTLPMLLALCLQAMYSAVDLWVVGWFGSAADVSAVSIGSQLMQTITSVVTGLAMGATILLGQHLGEGRRQEAGEVVGSAIALFGVLALVLTAALPLGARTLARLMQTPHEALAGTCIYLDICAGGEVFIVAYNVLGSIFRGIGDSRTPLFAVSIACACNIVGDIVLVGPCHMGVAGAALATVLSQGISVVLCGLAMRRHRLPFALGKNELRPRRRVAAKVLRLGAPVALEDLLVSISFLALLAIVNSLGLIASAGVGVAERLCSFIMLVPSSFMQSLSAFVAQNAGARQPVRARRAMLYGMAVSFSLGVVMAALAFFKGDMLAAIFAPNDPEVVAAAADYLRAYAIDTLLVSFLFCFVGYFNGYGKTGFVLIQGLLGAFGVRIPISWWVSRRPGVTLFHVGLATPCSTMVQIVLCTALYLRLRKKNSGAPPCPQDTSFSA